MKKNGLSLEIPFSGYGSERAKGRKAYGATRLVFIQDTSATYDMDGIYPEF
jgi:hypothetical protein